MPDGMPSFDELDQKIGRFADRLRSFQQERDQRTKLALTMLANIEHKVRSQRTALETANARIADLEKERDTAIARVSEIVDLYESSLNNNDAFFRGVEALAKKLIGAAETPGPASPPPRSLVEKSAAVQTTPKPPPAQPAPQRPMVQAPSKTPFLKEMGPGQVQPKDRLKNNGDGGSKP
jgi:hypothetical protein